MFKNEKDIENEIREITKQFNNKEISKRKYLKKQKELMQYALDNLKLSIVKRNYIKNALKLINMTLRVIK